MFMLRQVCSNRRAATHIGRCAQRFLSTTNLLENAESMVVPTPEGYDALPNPKLQAIVDDIAKLNLLEVSELSSLLKKTLNLPDAPMVAYGAASLAAPAAPVEEEEEAAGPAVIQTAFKVKLLSFDDSKKIALIKELKNQCEGMNLVSAKKFVESAPAFVKEDISKDDAQSLKEALEKVGAVVEVV